MSRKALREAADALEEDDARGVIQALTASVIQAARDEETADHLRFVRAKALLDSGRADAAAGVLRRFESDVTERPEFHRLAAAVHMANGDAGSASPHIVALYEGGATELEATWRSVQCKAGLDLLEQGDPRAARDSLRNAGVVQIADAQTRHAAWLGLMQANLDLGDHNGTVATFGLCSYWAEDPNANLLVAAATVRSLDLEPAIHHLRKSPATAHTWGLWLELARGLYKAGRHEDVVLYFKEMASRDNLDETGIAMALLAVFSLNALGRKEDAQTRSERLATAYPKNPSVRYYAGILAYLAGDRRRATRHLRSQEEYRGISLALLWVLQYLGGQHGHLREHLTPEILRTWPEGPGRETLRVLAAMSCTLQDQCARAEALIKDVASAQLPGTMPAAARKLGGYLALREGDFELATNRLGPSPWRDVAVLERARAQSDAGSDDEALADLSGLPDGGPLAAHVRETRGRILLKRAAAAVHAERFERADELLSYLRKKSPELADEVASLQDFVQVRMALAQLDASVPREAFELLKRLAGTPPPGATRALAVARERDLSFLAAVMLLRTIEMSGPEPRFTRELVTALDTALAADANYAPAAALLGVILGFQGESARALALLDVAQQGGITSPAIQVALAAEYNRQGRLVEAKRMVFGLLGTPEESPGLRRQLGELLRAESRPVLMPMRSSKPPPGVTIDPTTAVAPLADADPERRLYVLVTHLEAAAAQVPPEQATAWKNAARTLKRLILSSDRSGADAAEATALDLLASRSLL